MSPNRLVGVILLVVGAILLYFGIHATDSVSESVHEGVTGRYSDRTTWYIIGGAVAVIVGGMFASLGARPSRA